jgi:hypothetical protein
VYGPVPHFVEDNVLSREVEPPKPAQLSGDGGLERDLDYICVCSVRPAFRGEATQLDTVFIVNGADTPVYLGSERGQFFGGPIFIFITPLLCRVVNAELDATQAINRTAGRRADLRTLSGKRTCREPRERNQNGHVTRP